MFLGPVENSLRHLTRSLRAFQDRLAGHVETVFGLRLKPHEFHLDVKEVEDPPVAVCLEFMVPMDLLGWLVPMIIFRPMVERTVLRRARWEVAKPPAWHERAGAAIRDLCRQTQEAAGLELDALDQMLDSSTGKLATLTLHAQALDPSWGRADTGIVRP